MKRREFIQKTAASTALLSLGLAPLCSAAPRVSLSSFKSDIKHITILHTNDVHSHIDPFPMDDPRNPNMGGVARRASLIETIRKENPNVLLLDAGDIFQGTPYFNFYGGELEFKLMSMMKYDLSTIGNHDFDNGIDGLTAQMPHATFEFVSANYDFKWHYFIGSSCGNIPLRQYRPDSSVIKYTQINSFFFSCFKNHISSLQRDISHQIANSCLPFSATFV